MQELQIGQYGLSVILSALAAVVFMMCKKEDGSSCLTDKWKNLIVIMGGIGFGLLSIWYLGKPANVVNVVNGLLDGFFCAMSAVGLWKTLGIQTGRDILTTPSGGGITR